MSYTLYFTRPHTILGASLWNYWYTSKAFESIFGFVFSRGYMLGIPVGNSYIVRAYKDDGELCKMKESAIRYVTEYPKNALEFLEKGYKIQQGILSGDFKIDPLCTIEAAVELYAEVALYTAILPYFWFNETDIQNTKYHYKIQKLCVQLREVTVYPLFHQHALLPHLCSCTGQSEVELSMKTYTDLLKKDFRQVSEIGSTCFEYMYSNEGESLNFVSKGLLLAKASEIEKYSTDSFVMGTVVSKGFGSVEGIVRLVASDIDSFQEGEILVVPSLNNLHVPLFKKAKAILCEEGGTASHAIFLKNIDVPIITNVKGITLLVRDGEKVLVEPEQYRVHLRYE